MLARHVYFSALWSVKTFVALQALRISDHFPVEVELREVMPFWMEKTSQRHDNVNAQNASVSRAVTGTE